MKNITPLPVRDFVLGQKITVPGIYRNVPMNLYHGDICDGPSISSTGIRAIESKSLRHYYKDSYLNPDRVEDEDPKPHFGIGKALHHLAAGDGKFLDFFSIRPEEWDSWRTKEAKSWRAKENLARRTVLEPKDMIAIRGIAGSLGEHPTVQAGILRGLVEHSIFWKKDFEVGEDGEVQTIWFKSRPDVIPLDSNMIVDLKTTADAGPVSVRKSVGEFAYHIQLAMAYEGLLATTGRKMTDFVLAFAEKPDPWCINLKPIGQLSIEYGRRQFLRAARRFALSVNTGVWPGYDDDEVPCEIPDWLMKRLSKEAEDKLLPELEPDPVELDDAV